MPALGVVAEEIVAACEGPDPVSGVGPVGLEEFVDLRLEHGLDLGPERRGGVELAEDSVIESVAEGEAAPGV